MENEEFPSLHKLNKISESNSSIEKMPASLVESLKIFDVRINLYAKEFITAMVIMI